MSTCWWPRRSGGARLEYKRQNRRFLGSVPFAAVATSEEIIDRIVGCFWTGRDARGNLVRAPACATRDEYGIHFESIAVLVRLDVASVLGLYIVVADPLTGRPQELTLFSYGGALPPPDGVALTPGRVNLDFVDEQSVYPSYP